MEQTTGIEQVNRAVAQMDGVTQQNAALVEQAAAAAASLQEQAARMEDVAARFKLRQGGYTELIGISGLTGKAAPRVMH